MHPIRRLALLLVVVALGLTGLGTAPAQAAPGDDPTDPGGGTLAIKSVELLNTPVHGQAQRVRVTTNRPAAEAAVELYYSPSANAPLTDANRLVAGPEGTLAFATSPRFTPGTWHLVAVASTADFGSAQSNRVTFTVSPITTTLGFDRTTLAAHERLLVRPQPNVDTGVPATGTVTLTGPGGSNLGTVALSNGVAEFRLAPGSRSVTASYSGDGRWTPASAAATVDVARAVVTPAGTLSDDTVTQFDPVSIDVALSSSEPTYVPAGAYSLIAEPAGGGDDVVIQEAGYEGVQLHADLTAFAADHPGSWDLILLTSETDLHAFNATRVGTLHVAPGQVPTSVGIDAPATSVPFGSAAARVTATLSRSREAGAVDGQLRVLDGGRPTGVSASATSTAPVTIGLPTLAVGAHQLSVEYLGGTAYRGSTSEVRTVVVRKAATAAGIGTTKVAPGGVVRVTVGTTDSPAPAGGTVSLVEGGTTVATGVVVDGVADVRLPAHLKAGAHRFSAVYAGSPTHEAATSAESSVTVGATGKAGSTIGGKVTRTGSTVTVRAVVRSGVAVTGKVRVLDGKRVVRTLTLRAKDRGAVSLRLKALRPGTHAITVRYLGSAAVKASKKVFRVTVPRR